MSLLDELLVAMGMPALPGPAPGADAIQGVDPTLPSAPSLLEELLAAKGVPDTKALAHEPLPCKGWTLPSQVHPAS